MSLASNSPLRLPLLTAAQVRAAVACPLCGAEPGQPCRPRRPHTPPAIHPANHHPRVQAARLLAIEAELGRIK